MPQGLEAIAPIDQDQNNRIAWCEKLLYALVILQFPQIASLL